MSDPADITVHASADPVAVYILGHGAGAGQTSPFITGFAHGMVDRAVTTVSFDFPYITARRKVPDSAPVLEAHWLRVIEATRARCGNLPIFIGGKSMGGRIASQVAAGTHPTIAGLVFLGYPLHPPGRPDRLRDAHLRHILEPMLFVQGTRDPFGTASEIRDLLPRLRNAELHEVAGGDHSFKVTGRPGVKPPQVMSEIMDVVAAWMRQTLR